MTKDEVKRNFHVDPHTLPFRPMTGVNGATFFNCDLDAGYRITWDQWDGFVVSRNNQVCQWNADLSKFTEGRS